MQSTVLRSARPVMVDNCYKAALNLTMNLTQMQASLQLWQRPSAADTQLNLLSLFVIMRYP